MSYGKDERDIHKHVWELLIPMFDSSNDIHRRLAELGAALEKVVAAFKVDESNHFAATRRHIRDVVVATAEGQEVNDLAFDMLG